MYMYTMYMNGYAMREVLFTSAANVQAYFTAVHYIGPNKMLRTRLFVCPHPAFGLPAIRKSYIETLNQCRHKPQLVDTIWDHSSKAKATGKELEIYDNHNQLRSKDNELLEKVQILQQCSQNERWMRDWDIWIYGNWKNGGINTI